MYFINDFVKIILEIGNYMFYLNFVFGIILIFFERRNPSSLWAWLLCMYFLPVVGFIFYLFLGQDLRRKKMFEIKEIQDQLHSLVLLQEKKIKANKLELPDKRLESFKDMIRYHLTSGDAIYSSDNEVEIYTTGEGKFKALKQNLLNAKKYIHMEYYILRNDTLTCEIIDILCKKAQEGIEVRILGDGMGCIYVPKKTINKMRKCGVKVAIFFPPIIPYVNLRVNFRNHRKICIVDGVIGFVGGFNIGDEYLGLGKLGKWRDTHLQLKGSAIDGLQLRFALDWKYAAKENLLADIKYFPMHNTNGKVGMQIVSSGPDSKWQNVKNGFFKMIMEAEKNIYIQTPYLILDDGMLEALKIAALSGHDVRIMIPCKPDHIFVYWATYSYVGDLIKAGVKCYTYDEGFLHAKTIMVDGIASSVGTANMDIRSFKLNFEVNAFIYDPDTTEKLENLFIEDLKYCTEITEEVYKNRSLKVKFKESISRLLSPIL